MHTNLQALNADFTCKHCGAFVSTHKAASGVVNRNHCPYCLYSQHLDLFKAGDRLCACKALMAPVGLTYKNRRDKFSQNQQGELMLVHRCEYCGDLSINRVAADDDPLKLIDVFEHKSPEIDQLHRACQDHGISMLTRINRSMLMTNLFGLPSEEIRDLISLG